MENDKFFNYYIENLTNSLNEAIGKTIVFQTQQRVLSEENSTLKQNIDAVVSENSALRSELEGMSSNFGVIENLKIENQNLRENNSHMETFKNELISCRKELEEARSELEKAKLELEEIKTDNQKVVAKPQKIEAKSDSKIKTNPPIPKKNFVKDGGSF